MAKPIFILGVNRSGTSLLAQMIHLWGAYGGDVAELRRGNEGNLRGYWENRAVQRFLGEIAEEIGLLHPQLPQRCRELAHAPRYRDRALELIAEMEQHGRTWFWKDPLLSVLAPFWRELLDEIVFVVAVRNPYECARSWELFTLPAGLPKGFSTVAANLLRWQHYTRSLLAATAGAATLFVPYEALLTSPLEHGRRIAAFLDRHCGAGAGDARPDEVVKRMVQAAEPGLRHVRPAVQFLQVPEATPEQKALYELLLRKVDVPEAEYDPERYPLFAGWQEYLQNLALMSRLLAEAGPMLDSRAVRLTWALTLPWRMLHRRLSRSREGPPTPVSTGATTA
jgi:hypothetical protein